MESNVPAEAAGTTPAKPLENASPMTAKKTASATRSPQTRPSSKHASKAAPKRQYVSQEDVPGCTLDEALRIARAISDNYAKAPTAPIRVAQALGVQPSSGSFRGMCGASIAYGITEGGAASSAIQLTPLGKRIVAPTVEGDDLKGKKEAVLRPRVLREFLTRYDASRLPAQNIACNVLEELGVPPAATERTFRIILENAQELGLLTTIKDQRYVDLQRTTSSGASPSESELDLPPVGEDSSNHEGHPAAVPAQPPPVAMVVQNNAVFITHGKNKEILGQIKQILSYGNYKPVVSEERETLSKPVPEKVLEDMRSCAAAIIHVDKERDLLDQDGKTHAMLNPNVLIEIGAAMALYRGKFILLVQKGVTLPSNLQGLYEVRYEGDRLDYDATMKLLQAFAGFKA